MKSPFLIGVLCLTPTSVGAAYAAYSHEAWPVAAAGLFVVVLFQVFDVWGRIDRAIEAAHEESEKQ